MEEEEEVEEEEEGLDLAIWAKRRSKRIDWEGEMAKGRSPRAGLDARVKGSTYG